MSRQHLQNGELKTHDAPRRKYGSSIFRGTWGVYGSQTYIWLTPVPALTLHVGIKLNERVSLPLRALTLRCENRTLPHVRDHRGRCRRANILRSAASFDVGNAANVSAEFRNKT